MSAEPAGVATRRRLTRTTLAVVAVAATALSLAACSSSSKGSSSGGGAGSTAAAGSSAGAGASTGSAAGGGSSAGAGSGGSSSAASGGGLTKDDALYNALPASYQKNGVKVAVFNDWPPDEFIQNGQLTGWSVDLAKDLSILLGVKFSYTPTSFDAVLPGIQNSRFDAGFASFAPTADRLKVLDFIPERSDGTAYASLKSSNINIKQLSDICGHTVAVLTGAFDYQYLTTANSKTCAPAGKPQITIKQFTTQSAAQLAMTSGRVQLVAAGSATLGYLATQDPKITVSSFVANPLYNCIGVRKGDPLGQVLADGMQKLIDLGVYQQVMTKWGVGKADPVSKGMLITAAHPNG